MHYCVLAGISTSLRNANPAYPEVQHMTAPRSSPYLYVTWPAKYLTGDKSCLWALLVQDASPGLCESAQ